MANFAILRIQKLKSTASVHRSLKHSFRTQYTPNANEELTIKNSYFGTYNSEKAFKIFKEKLPEKRRKDAVLAVEFLITASPEAMASKSRLEQDNYLEDSYKWLTDKYGDRLICGGIHRDETTPHLYAYIVPLVDGKLNAKGLLGGDIQALSRLQDEFYEDIGKKHELTRGLKNSKALHKDIKKYYQDIQLAKQARSFTHRDLTPQITKETFFSTKYETPEELANRLNAKIAGFYGLEKEKEQLKEQTRKQAQSIERLNNDYVKRSLFLSPEGKKKVQEFSDSLYRKQLENEKKEKEKILELERTLKKDRGLSR